MKAFAFMVAPKSLAVQLAVSIQGNTLSGLCSAKLRYVWPKAERMGWSFIHFVTAGQISTVNLND